jgi:hypothetical protein
MGPSMQGFGGYAKARANIELRCCMSVARKQNCQECHLRRRERVGMKVSTVIKSVDPDPTTESMSSLY